MIRTFQSKSIPAIFLIALLLPGCATPHRPIFVPPIDPQMEEGILITATHRQDQSFLYFIDGVSVKLNERNTVSVPWTFGRLFQLPPGTYRVEIWYDYFGMRANVITGCFVLNRSQVLQLRYENSLWVNAVGHLTVVDLKENKLLEESGDCFSSGDFEKKEVSP
jgi:hypothetical protein